MRGCDRCGALERLGWAVHSDGRLFRLCPTHLASEHERAAARARAETDVRTRFRLAALVPRTFAGFPVVDGDQAPPDIEGLGRQPEPAAAGRKGSTAAISWSRPCSATSISR